MMQKDVNQIQLSPSRPTSIHLMKR